MREIIRKKEVNSGIQSAWKERKMEKRIEEGGGMEER
jgi:hypothetical protein